MKLRQAVAAALTTALLAPAMSPPAAAQAHRRHEVERRHKAERWHDHDILRFRGRDFDLWRRGRWIHGRHDGREGWWWVVAGIWYFYPRPVYPYPDPYAPPVVTGPAPGTYYYYCRYPAGYYPYVPVCRVPWQPVAAAPPAIPPPPNAAVPPPGTPPPQ